VRVLREGDEFAEPTGDERACSIEVVSVSS
jgi:hypothetical protein